MAAGWWMVVAGIGRTCFALSHVYLSSAACGVWSGEWWGVVGDQLIIYLDVGPLAPARSPAKIIWIRQTGAHTHSGREQKNVMNHQVY